MAPSILVFDFGADDALAQQARHKVDGWKQGFRLGNKMLLKVEREELSGENGESEAHATDAERGSKAAARSGKESKHKESERDEEKSAARVRVLVRLDFSDHEKLSHQRWLDRIPSEEPFKSAKGETIRAADAAFEKTEALFESLE
jgi:hypothetical protein